MDSIRNPFVPGAGSPPVELAGRDTLLEEMRVALQRARIGRHAKSAMLVQITLLRSRLPDFADQKRCVMAKTMVAPIVNKMIGLRIMR